MAACCRGQAGEMQRASQRDAEGKSAKCRGLVSEMQREREAERGNGQEKKGQRANQSSEQQGSRDQSRVGNSKQAHDEMERAQGKATMAQGQRAMQGW